MCLNECLKSENFPLKIRFLGRVCEPHGKSPLLIPNLQAQLNIHSNIKRKELARFEQCNPKWHEVNLN